MTYPINKKLKSFKHWLIRQYPDQVDPLTVDDNDIMKDDIDGEWAISDPANPIEFPNKTGIKNSEKTLFNLLLESPKKTR